MSQIPIPLLEARMTPHGFATQRFGLIMCLVSWQLVAWSCSLQAQVAGSSENHTVPAPGKDLKITPIYAASNLSRVEAVRAVLHTQADLERYWRKAHEGIVSPVPVSAPILDFTREMVIVAGLGYQANSASNISIARVTDRRGILEVIIKIGLTSGNCPVFPAAEYPAVIVRVPNTPSTPVFTDRVSRTQC